MNKLARACAVSLMVSFFLCVAGWAQAETRLIFPRFSFDPGTFTGLALVNVGAGPADLTLTAYGTAGQELAGPGFTNPAELRLEPGQRTSKLIQEIFGAALSPVEVGWVEIQSSAPGVTGFFLFLNGSLTQFDGADLPQASREIVFNLVRHDLEYSTELNLVNPGSAPAPLAASLVRPQLPVLQTQFTLAGRAVARRDAAELFQLQEIPRGSYVKVTSTSGEIAGFQFVRSSGDLLGLNAKPSSEKLSRLMFPQMVFGEPWSSELGVVNYSNQSVIVTIFARKADGSLFDSNVLTENPVTRGLAPGQALNAELAQLFGLKGSQGYDGWLEVKCDTTSINGYVAYGIPSVGSLAGVASAPAPQKQFVFSHVATSAGFFTGVALLNPASLTVNTRVLALDNDGNRLGTWDSPIRPGQRISALVTELIEGSDNLGGGMLWVTSEVPVYASSLFGAAKVLANVPPQSSPSAYRPDEGLPRVVVQPPLAVVQPGRSQKFTATGANGSVRWLVDGIPGGTAGVGVIDALGNYTAPANRPNPSYVTVTAEASLGAGGASVDVLDAQSLLSGLGILQSVAYLQSLQRLFEVELLSAGFAGKGASPASEAQQASQSELFQVEAPSIKTSFNTYPDNMVKLLVLTSDTGREYLLLLGQNAGTITRLDPTSRATRVVYTGLKQPTTMAWDTLTGNLLVAETNRIVSIARDFLFAGLTAGASLDEDSGVIPMQTGLLDVVGATGLGVDPCTGDIYFSQASSGTLFLLKRSTGEVQVIVSGLGEPGQLLVLERKGMVCPDSVQILVAEPGSERIALIDPVRKLVTSWIPAPGIRDLTLMPPGNPFTGKFSVAYGVFIDLVGEIGLVDIEDQYEDDPVSELQPTGPCVSPVVFPDPRLAAAVRAALELEADEDITCEQLEGLTSLNAAGRRIQSLAGIQFATGLRILDVSRNRITSLVPVGDLVELESLNASFNLITELGLLANLRNLQFLNLSRNLIQDLSGLQDPETTPESAVFYRNLVSLQQLDLSYNQIANSGPISRLGPNLTNFNVAFNQIRTLDFLLEDPDLKPGTQVDLRGNPLSLGDCGVIEQLLDRGINVIFDLRCPPDLYVQIEPNAVSADVGDLLEFNITAVNRLSIPAKGVALSVQIPPSATLVEFAGGSGSCTPSGTSALNCVLAGLASPAEWQVQITLRVEPGAVDFTVPVQLTSSVADLEPSDNQASASVAVPGIDLSLTKSASPNPAITGRPITYSIVVTNLGTAAATNVTIVDDLPGGIGIAFPSFAGGTCTREGLELTCILPILAAGATVTLTIDATVEAFGGELVNTATVSADQFDPVPANNSFTLRTVIGAADLAISKTDSADPVGPGDPLTYNLTVNNNGPNSAFDVVVVDNLPAGVTFGSAVGADCAFSAGRVTCELGTMPSGGSTVIVISTTVTAITGTLTNTATVTSSVSDPISSNNTAIQTTTVRSADLSITKTDSADPVNSGAPLTYTVTVTNNGPDTAVNVGVTDTLPAGLTFVSVTPAECSFLSGTVSCLFSSLAAGQSQVININTTVSAATGTLSNTASVVSSVTDPVPGNNSATQQTQVVSADLSVVKTGSADPVSPGDTLTYTVTVSNSGPDDATNVVVTDTLPAGVSFVSVSPIGANCSHSAGTVTCVLGTLASDLSEVITIETTVTALTGTLTNSASVSANETDPVGSNNSSVVQTTVRSADLSITKVDSPDPVGPGDFLTYTITVTNNGPDTAPDFTVSDILPATLSIYDATPEACSWEGNQVDCFFGPLTSGASQEITIVAWVVLQSGTIENTATVSSTLTDPDLSNNSATASTTVASADLSITKVGSPNPVNSTSTLTYTITVSNAGPDAAENVVVSDTLPAGFSYQSSSLPGCVEGDGVVTCELGTLANGGSTQFTISGTVSALTGSLSNQASVTSDTKDTFTSDNDAFDNTTVVSADLSVSKSDSADPVLPGDEVIYYVLINNLGPDDASNVVVVDTVPAVFSIQSVSAPGASCEVVTNTVTCTIPVLDADTEYQISITTQVGAITEEVSNSATVTSDVYDPVLANNSATETTRPATADLSITKVADPDPAATGQSLTYTLTVSNAGPDDATNVVVTDVLPAEAPLSHVFPETICVPDFDNNVVNCLFPLIESGGGEVQITILAGVSAPSGVLSNSASVSADQLDPDPSNNSVLLETPIAQVDLQITKTTADTPVYCSTDPTYTVTVTNLGPDAATGVTFEDLLLSSDQYVIGFNATPNLSCVFEQFGDLVSCAVNGALGSGESAAVDVATSFSCEPSGLSLDNTAQILTVDQTDTDPSNNSVTYQNPLALADIQVAVTDDPDPVVIGGGIGGTITVTVTVTNAGPVNATDVSSFFNTDTALSILTATPDQGSCAPSGTFASCDLGGIAAGNSVTIVFEINVPPTTPEGNYSHSISAYSGEFDPDSSNDFVQEQTTVEVLG